MLASWYQVTIFPTDQEQPVEIEADNVTEDFRIVEGILLDGSNGKLRIQPYPCQPVKVSITGQGLAGIRHLSNTTHIRLKSLVGEQQEFINPSPVIPVFMARTIRVSPPSTSAVGATSTQALETPSPTPVVTSTPSVQLPPMVHLGGASYAQGLTDIEVICRIFFGWAVDSCRSHAFRNVCAVSGIGVGLLVGLISGLVRQDPLFIAVAVGSAVILGGVGYAFGTLLDKARESCATTARSVNLQAKAEHEAPSFPRNRGPSKARQIASMPDISEEMELCELTDQDQVVDDDQCQPTEVVITVEIETTSGQEEEGKEDKNEEPEQTNRPRETDV